MRTRCSPGAKVRLLRFLPCDVCSTFPTATNNEFIVGQRPEPRVPGPGRAGANRRPAGSLGDARSPLPASRAGLGLTAGSHRRQDTAHGPARPPPPSPQPGDGGCSHRGGGARRCAQGLPGRPTWAARLTWALWASGDSGPRDRWVPPTGPPRPFAENQTQPPRKRELRARRLLVALQVPEVPSADRRPPLPRAATQLRPRSARPALHSYSPRLLRKNQLTAGAVWMLERTGWAKPDLACSEATGQMKIQFQT
nr:collagen alpha-1(I) chain-like [Bubalus bubalis]